jgi:uncharacterized protein YprB with RNaseH-like and TPR domain
LDCDIETSGLTFTDDYILCIGISYAKNESVVIPQDMVKTAATKRLLEDAAFHYIWHDGKFDINFLRHQKDCIKLTERWSMETLAQTIGYPQVL